MWSAGVSLRKIRDQLGLTMRDVENASLRISERQESEEYLIPPSRLSDIETKGVVPSVFRFYSLAAIYRKPMRDLLMLYGIDPGTASADWSASQPANSHTAAFEPEHSVLSMPVKLDPGFDVRETGDLGRLVQQWGPVPFAFLSQLASQRYTYAFVGTEDLTMFPILQPGSFVQVDEARRRVVEHHWRSEYERPIYFVETREGFTCCWCSFRSNTLILQPHPLSPAPVRVLKHPQEAEVIGQVVGVAMRIGHWRFGELAPRATSGQRSDAVLTSVDNLKVTGTHEIRSASSRKTLD